MHYVADAITITAGTTFVVICLSPPPLNASKAATFPNNKRLWLYKTVAAYYFSWKVITNGWPVFWSSIPAFLITSAKSKVQLQPSNIYTFCTNVIPVFWWVHYDWPVWVVGVRCSCPELDGFVFGWGFDGVLRNGCPWVPTVHAVLYRETRKCSVHSHVPTRQPPGGKKSNLTEYIQRRE